MDRSSNDTNPSKGGDQSNSNSDSLRLPSNSPTFELLEKYNKSSSSFLDPSTTSSTSPSSRHTFTTLSTSEHKSQVKTAKDVEEEEHLHQLHAAQEASRRLDFKTAQEICSQVSTLEIAAQDE